MNFIETYKRGKKGKNLGLSTGLPALDKTMGGIYKKRIYGIAAAAKCGKTTFTDFSFLIQPFLYKLKNPEFDIEFKYFSMEVDRTDKMFKIASYFFYKDFGISNFKYLDREYELNARYLKGEMQDHLGNLISVSKEHEDMLKQIYNKYLITLFGEYNTNNICTQKGLAEVIEGRKTPTEIKNILVKYALNNGKLIYKDNEIVSYTPNNPDKYTIIIFDHLRKLNIEKGQTMKSNMDNLLHVQVELRNFCEFTFVDILHLNRSLSSMDRIKFFSDKLYPNGDDLKDSGNLSEEADYLLTMFYPQDEKYNLKSHFGRNLEAYPNYRSIHVVESRHSPCPVHTAVNLYPNINFLQPIV